MDYSIWIIPQNELYKNLANTISNLAKKFSAPIFEPHITLLGDIAISRNELLSRSYELAHSLEPFEVSLTSLDQDDEYLHCVFLKAANNYEIIEANLLARNLFGREDDTKFEPHISLLYGNFPKPVRDEIISDLEGRFKPQIFSIKELYVVLSSSNIPPIQWKILEAIKLSRQ